MGLVQQANTWPTTSASSTALAFNTDVAAGSYLITPVAWNDTTVTVTVADNINGAWTSLGGPQNGSGGLSTFRIQLFRFKNATGGTITVTATFSAAVTRRALAIAEFSGIDTSATPEDGSAQYQAVNSTGITSPTITTTNQKDLLFAAAVAGLTISGAGSSYSMVASPGPGGTGWGGNGTEYKYVTALGSYTPNFTQSAVQDNLVAFVAVKSVADPDVLPANPVIGLQR